jgi:hypothetical protein
LYNFLMQYCVPMCGASPNINVQCSLIYYSYLHAIFSCYHNSSFLSSKYLSQSNLTTLTTLVTLCTQVQHPISSYCAITNVRQIWNVVQSSEFKVRIKI